MWRLARETVDPNSPYGYLMLTEYFADTCAVAEHEDGLAGFVTGFRRPDDPETLFIWQIAVSPAQRGRGLGSHLLDHVSTRPVVPRLRFLEATVTPSNTASASLFRRFAALRRAECVEETLFERNDFPDREHEPEIRFRIGPF